MKNEEYLKNYNANKYEKLSVTVDILIFTISDNKLKVRLVKRDKPPFDKMLSIPGTFVKPDESLDEAVKRVLKDKAGFENIYFEQLYSFGEVDRDPRMRIISISYISILSEKKLLEVMDKDTIDKEFYSVDEMLEEKMELAFDHKKIIEYAKKRLADDVEKTDIAFEFVPEKFTLPFLQKVHEILLGHSIYKANFRKKVSVKVEETEEYTSGDAFRPSKYYIRKK